MVVTTKHQPPGKTCRIYADHRHASIWGIIGILWSLGIWHEGKLQLALLVAAASLVLLGFRVVLVCKHHENLALLRWSVFGIPLLTRQRAKLSTATAVTIRRRMRYLFGSNYSNALKRFFPVQLQSNPVLVLQSTRDYLSSRCLAERIAQVLDLPLRDIAHGPVVTRKPGELNMPLGERMRARRKPPQQPTAYTDTRLRFNWNGNTVRVRFPAQPVLWIGYVIAIIVPVMLYVVMINSGEAWLARYFIGPIAVIIWFFSIASFFPRFMDVDARGIRVHWFVFRKTIPWQKLEEVASGFGGVYLLNDRLEYDFPFDFDTDTANEIKALLEYLAWVHAPPSG